VPAAYRVAMARMHADELEIDEALVRGLLAAQFAHWADLPLARVEPAGTVNAVYRLGDDLAVRLARRNGPSAPGAKEVEWLPRLAPLLPLEIPVPVGQGRPTADYPWHWEVHRWVDGETVPVDEIDAIRAASDLASFVAALHSGPILPAGRRGEAFRWRNASASSDTGWPGSRATAAPSRPSGSKRSRPSPGTVYLSGTTATSMCATGSCGTGGSAG
jgi:aminoglycoside phosphotransferase (APT) family kinase protein